MTLKKVHPEVRALNTTLCEAKCAMDTRNIRNYVLAYRYFTISLFIYNVVTFNAYCYSTLLAHATQEFNLIKNMTIRKNRGQS